MENKKQKVKLLRVPFVHCSNYSYPVYDFGKGQVTRRIV